MKKRFSFSPAILSPLVFLLIIFSFSLCSFLTADREFSESENRYLEQLPKFSLKALFASEFTESFEKYVVDQFPARDLFVGVKAQSEFIMGKRDTNGIFFGKDGYLINRYDKTTVDMNKFRSNLKYISIFAENSRAVRGVNFYTMLVPSAQAIHTDKLPKFAPGLDQTAEFDSVRSSAGQGYVDVSAVFAANRDKLLYYKTDHHWTTYGAFLAYREFCKTAGITAPEKSDFTVKTVSEDFYGTAYSKARLISTKPDKIEIYVPKKPLAVRTEPDGKESREGLYFDEYLSKRDKYSYFLGGNNPLVTVTSNAGTGRKLLIIRDSYAHCFAPFAANDFDKVFLIDLRYYNGSVSKFIRENAVTDVLVLYGMESLQSETSIVKLIK